MMDDKTKADYERAAAMFESGACPNAKPNATWKQVYWDAWHRCNNQTPGPASVRDVDNRAARLLRECVARNEVLK